MEIEYSPDKKGAFVDGHRFTRDDRTGCYLAATATFDGRRERLHAYMWRTRMGAVPDGVEVHHVDEDKGNNEVSNLELLPVHDRRVLHGAPMTDERREALRRNLRENAAPKAAEWHASEEGRAWHSEHARRMWEKTGGSRYVCTMCGKEFTSRKRYRDGSNRFCSGACKSAFRRMMGYDNEERTCVVCGSRFVTGKYGKVVRCKRCAHVRLKKG